MKTIVVGMTPTHVLTTVVDERPWVPVKAPDEPLNVPRSAEAYARALDSLPLLESLRYRPVGGVTFCNIFVWDCTRLLGCEVPHWCDSEGRQSPAGRGRELTANGMRDWLEVYGPERGWTKCKAIAAQVTANLGHPTVAVWRNLGGTGHVAMVRPGEADPVKGPCIAQAGKRNFYRGHVRDGFGAHPVEYFVHLSG